MFFSVISAVSAKQENKFQTTNLEIIFSTHVFLVRPFAIFIERWELFIGVGMREELLRASMEHGALRERGFSELKDIWIIYAICSKPA